MSGDHAHDECDHQCDQQTHRGELESDRQPFGDGLAHGLTRQRRGSEIAPDRVGQPPEVLAPEGRVEAELGVQFGDRLGSCVLPQDDLGDGAGRETEQADDRDGHQQDHQQAAAHLFRNCEKHPTQLSSYYRGRGSRRRRTRAECTTCDAPHIRACVWPRQ
jgi:hypothetical protein